MTAKIDSINKKIKSLCVEYWRLFDAKESDKARSILSEIVNETRKSSEYKNK